MSLAKLVVGAGGSVSAVELAKDVALTSIEYDSRKVRQGSLFVALRGLVSDGHDFIADAVNRGAVALVVERSRLDEFRHYADRGLALLAADDSRRALALASASLRDIRRVTWLSWGVTRTNGQDLD
jgi:UDP-N-acetylmuramoyl-L-alanyl-D-glutamate--2,6-diaminopimelate ligase